MISVVIPTIKGREEHYGRCIRAYEQHGGDLEIIAIHDLPTCGEAWKAGAERATGGYLHFTADDLEPHAGWWQAALEVVEDGKIPCPAIWGIHGRLEASGDEWHLQPEGKEVEIARVPFMKTEWYDESWILDGAHYYTDNWLAVRAKQMGYPTVVCNPYAFTHHWAQEGRMVDMKPDLVRYREACAA